MFLVILLAITCGSKAQDGEVFVSDNKTECINDMIKWCKGMQYPQQGAGMTMESITYNDPSGLFQDEVFCSSDSDGTVCKKNDIKWFSCSPNKKVTYNGQILIANTSVGIDDDICKTANMAFNDLLVQNLSFQNETLKEEVQQSLEAFFQQISDIQDQMDRMQDQLDTLTLLFQKYVLGVGVTDSSPFQGQTDMTTVYPSDDSLNTADQINLTVIYPIDDSLNTTDQLNQMTVLSDNNDNLNNTDQINPTTIFPNGNNNNSLNTTDKINLIDVE